MIQQIFSEEKRAVKNIVNRLFRVLLIASVGGILFVNIEAAKLSPGLQSQFNGLANTSSVGVVIVSFNTTTADSDSISTCSRSVGITSAVTFQRLGMVGAVLTAGQVRSTSGKFGGPLDLVQ